MKLISHRGNISGKKPSFENHPNYILEALANNYECEIDIFVKNDNLYLGHDYAQYKIDPDFIYENCKQLWIHCKNIDAIYWFLKNKEFHFFWHENDKITLTSKNIIWAFPGNQPIIGSVAVLPEVNNEIALDNCFGICSDYIENYKNKYEKVQIR